MYAIVDIETTGAYASANGITEISILIHDGNGVIDRYETLINPGMSIPPYIQALTGIDDNMVSDAPYFKEIAEDIFNLLNDKIFVAHSVNFDYSYIKHQLSSCGFDLQCKKLCTVRLSRKIFPGLPSYSLGKLCNSLKIPLENRHRAGGDAAATSILFKMLLENDTENHIGFSLKKTSKEQVLPPNLPKSQIEKLPLTPGVYYFMDQKGKVIYVGKAKNIKKRVCSHFSGNNPGKQRQDFMAGIYSLSYEECSTELISFILESIEIKRLWPTNNRAMKRFEQKFGLYDFEDQKGLIRLMVDKHKKFIQPLFSFGNIRDGQNFLQKLMREFQLCPKMCFIQRNNDQCIGIAEHFCKGVCEGKEEISTYNLRVTAAVEYLHQNMPSFVLKDKGRTLEEESYLLVEKGKFYGMGYLHSDLSANNIDELKTLIKPYPSNDYILNMIFSHAEKFPEKMMVF